MEINAGLFEEDCFQDCRHTNANKWLRYTFPEFNIDVGQLGISFWPHF
jgi:hypothetical protein